MSVLDARAGRARRIATTALLQLAVLAVVAWLWWVGTDVLPGPTSIAHGFSPEEAFPTLVDLVGDGTLLEDAGTSLLRLLVGLGAAIVVGVPVGLLVGGVPLADRATGALFQFLRMTSPLSWAPIAVLLLGVGSRPVEALVAIAAVWPVVINTAAGVRALDPDWLLTARSLGASRSETLRTVVVPGVRAHALTGVRLALGVSWIVLVPAEMLGVQSGLGYAVLNARDQLAYDALMATVLAIGLLGLALDLLAQALLRPRRRRRPASVALARAHADERPAAEDVVPSRPRAGQAVL
ncbi:ABC transporter permease [Patulibacter sp. S7RM1-6]